MKAENMWHRYLDALICQLIMINWDESLFWTSMSILRVGDLCLNSHLLCAGVWTQVLEAIGVLAVIANGLVIGVSSDFVPRLVYRYRYGPCATGGSNTQSVKNRGCEKKSCHLSWVKSPVVTRAFFLSLLSQLHARLHQWHPVHSLHGSPCGAKWLHTETDDHRERLQRHRVQVRPRLTGTVTQRRRVRSWLSPYCPHSYRDYRSDEDYKLTAQFWVVMAVRFAFVILFEVCSGCVCLSGATGFCVSPSKYCNIEVFWLKNVQNSKSWKIRNSLYVFFCSTLSWCVSS